MASTDNECPVCLGENTFTNQAGENRSGSGLTDCVEVFMKKPSDEGRKIIEKVMGCRFCTNWNHTSDQCCMPQRFQCRKQDLDIIISEKTTMTFCTGQNPNTASQCPSKIISSSDLEVVCAELQEVERIVIKRK